MRRSTAQLVEHARALNSDHGLACEVHRQGDLFVTNGTNFGVASSILTILRFAVALGTGANLARGWAPNLKPVLYGDAHHLNRGGQA